MKRSVVVLNHFAAPRSAAGGTRHVELFGRLESWDATIIAADRNYLTGERMVPEGIYTTVPTIPYTRNSVVRVLNWVSYAFMAFIRSLRVAHPDVVYASSPHLLTGLVGLALARLRRARFVLEVRDMWPRILVDMDVLSERSLLYRALARLETYLYRRADAMVALADGLREQMVEHGAPAERVSVVPNGPEPSEFVAPAARDELRRRYGLTGIVVAYTGAHGPANGLDIVLDAARDVRGDLGDVTFLLVGDGADKPQLVQRAQRDGLDNVRFMDPVPKRDMPALLGAVDIGLLVFADKPIFARHMSANKLYDYMAAGLPVITTVGGEGRRGVLEANAGIAVGPSELADAVRRMVAETPEARSRYGEAGRVYITETQSRSAMAARLQEILDGLVRSA
jgi:glycosyltransferase involved in cell wall biosynthesis